MKKFILSFSFSIVLKFVSAQCPPATAFDYLDINNVKARINNGGDMWWDLTLNAQYIVPKTGNVSSMFSGALWIGGVDGSGQLHVAAQTYRQNGNDFFPGPLDANGNTDALSCSNFDRIWKVNKSTIDSFTTGLFATTPTSILGWPGKGNPNLSFLPNQDLAPFIDVNGDSNYNPADGDYPNIPGDQALWFVFNDKGNTHTESFGSAPIGLEVQCFAYAVKNSSNCLNNTTFYHYKLLNKSSSILDSTFIGLWTDAQLGCGIDDIYGCDATHNLGIVYNSDAMDGPCGGGYGNHPPILATDFLKGPVDENGITHRLDYCMFYDNNFTPIGNPENSIDYYNYLHAVWKDSTPLTYGGNGYGGSSPSDFAFDGDPSLPYGWSMCDSTWGILDWRMILSSGPFTLKPGIAQTLDFAVVWKDSIPYPCPSFSYIEPCAAEAENYFNNIDFTGVNEVHAQPVQLTSFPNPFSSQTTIHIYSVPLNKNSSLAILDVLGRDVSNQFTVNYSNNDVVLNRNNAAAGVYFFSVMNDAKKIASGKLVVE